MKILINRYSDDTLNIKSPVFSNIIRKIKKSINLEYLEENENPKIQ